jgi:hypothetical protein
MLMWAVQPTTLSATATAPSAARPVPILFMCQSPLRGVRASCPNTTEPGSETGRAHRQHYVSGHAGIDYADRAIAEL